MGISDASCARLPRIMILNRYIFFYFSLCFFVFAKQVLSAFRGYCFSTRASSSRKRHEFYCFCCRLCIDDDGNVVIVVVGGGGSSGGGNDGGDGGGNCCCCRSCSCWGVLAYHHTRRLGVSQSSSASWTATKNTLYHLNTQTLVKSWSEFQESNRNMLDNSPLSPSLSFVFALVYVLNKLLLSFLSFIHSLSFSLSSASFFTLAFPFYSFSHSPTTWILIVLNLPSP